VIPEMTSKTKVGCTCTLVVDVTAPAAWSYCDGSFMSDSTTVFCSLVELSHVYMFTDPDSPRGPAFCKFLAGLAISTDIASLQTDQLETCKRQVHEESQGRSRCTHD